MRKGANILNKINTFFRLLIVGLLIYPMPIAMGAEVTVSENFNDLNYQAGLTVSGGNQAAYIYAGEQDRYGTTGSSLGITSGTYSFEFSSDIDVYEVGFVVGAVNYAWSIKWYYADGTDETVSKNAQNNQNLDNMYETIYKSYTDYNAVAENTDKFITKFEVILSDLSVLDTLYWQYDDSTSTGSFATTTTTTTTVLTSGIGDPANLTVSANLHNGSISIDWDAATGYQTNAERYAVAFSNDNFQSMNYAVATGNVGSANALNTEYTFTKTYLDSEFDAGDTIYFKVRADNDTNSQYSNWTSIASYTIQDVASGVTNVAITNNEYQGLKLGWTQPNTGWSTVESYRIEYKLSSEDTYTGIDIADVSTVSYLIEDISAGTYDFVVYSCTDNGSYCHGGQAGPVTNYEVLSTTAVTTTTTTTIYVAPPPPPPPPPPAPEEIIVDVKVEGVDKTYTQADVNDGTIERDQERIDNEKEFGCFMTNVALERGDCEGYNIALYNSTTTTTIPEIIEEEVVEEEILDDTITEKDDILDDKDTKKDEITDKELLPDDEIPILDDEIFIEEEIFDDSEEVITDGELVEDNVEEPIKEETLEDLPIVEEIIEDIPSVEETIIEVMEVIEIPEQDNTETAPKINVSTLTEVQKEVVQEQVTKVTKAEDVQNMSQEEKTVAAAALGVQEEELEIVAELSENDESVSQAVEEFVERASEVPEGNEYTLADAITEVQVEAFLENPLQELTDISIEEFAENLANVSEIGNDMTNDQKEKAQEVVVPVIIASQIIAQAGSLMRRF